MKIEQAVEVLSQHQKWRRGEHDKATDPKKLGEAIDMVLHRLPGIITGNARYEKLRKLTPRKFDELYQNNMRGKRFDDLVDGL